MQPGAMRERVRFDPRTLDGNGRPLGPWDTSGQPVAAHLKYLTSGEPVMQARLNGIQTVVITVRDSQASRLITNAWRAYDTRASVAYDIKGNKPAEQPGYREITVVSEGANG